MSDSLTRLKARLFDYVLHPLPGRGRQAALLRAVALTAGPRSRYRERLRRRNFVLRVCCSAEVFGWRPDCKLIESKVLNVGR